jgi:PKD repeat protein
LVWAGFYPCPINQEILFLIDLVYYLHFLTGGTMKTCLTVFLAIFLLSSAAWADGIKKVDQPQGIPSFLGYVPDRFIVVMKPQAGELNVQMTAKAIAHISESAFDLISDKFEVSSIIKEFPGSERKSVELTRYYKVNIEAGTLEDAMEAYRHHPLVEKVEPIGIHAMYATPNDGYYSYQWHLNQTSDHDIDAPEAWNIEAGSTAIILAILDSGTRYYHPDLGGVNASPSNPGASRGNMWINTAELNGSAGVDDDGNGYVDDWIGYDFIQSTTNCWSGEDCNTKDNDPRDFNGHGTHTSGIFGMLTNNGYGMCGVAGGWGNGSQAEYGNGVKIMALRMGYSYNYGGQEYGVVLMDAAAEAFYYAANNGAKIASCSWGSSNSGGIAAAVTYFLNHGGIIFVAAGNANNQTADYLNGRGDCISVAATNESDNGASFTTYGTWVDICAPGNNIYSTYHDHTDPNTNYWASMSGTSMATPMAAGVGALIWSHNPSWTAAQVTSQLYSSADNIDAYLSSKYIGKMGAGRINAYNAVNTGPPPPPVAQFSGSPTSGTVPLTVNFTDLSTGSVTSWSWTFGDGGTSTVQNPSHQYTSTGTFTVSLTVTGPGGSDGETKNNYITVNPCIAPTANFVGSPTSGYAPLTVNFTDQSSGSPTSWSWNFGDGGTSTAQNPSHTYTSAGTFTVSLTVTNSCGSDGETKTGYITVTTSPQQCDDFSDGNISDWGNKLGTWTATGGYMKGNSNTTDARTTSPFGTFGAMSINCDIRMNTGRTSRIARIIFAYQNANNYRFAQFDDKANQIRIYDRVSGRNSLKASANVSMSSGVWYSVTVNIAAGGNVSIVNAGNTLLSYNFGNVITGLVGVGFDRSNSDFDNFCVGVTSLSGFVSQPGENMKLLAGEIMPQNFSLSQNYPNPFNPVTHFSLDLVNETHVTFVIYNVAGQKVRTLADEVMPAGSHTFIWDGTNENGQALSSGVYFYRVTAGDESVTKKMMLLK